MHINEFMSALTILHFKFLMKRTRPIIISFGVNRQESKLKFMALPPSGRQQLGLIDGKRKCFSKS